MSRSPSISTRVSGFVTRRVGAVRPNYNVCAMLVTVYSFARAGAVRVPVQIEVDAAPGKPSTIVIGLPEHQARESILRVEEALTSLGYHLPTGRTIVKVMPIGIAKDADALELPIAVGLLLATGQTAARAGDSPVVGNLSQLSETVEPKQI